MKLVFGVGVYDRTGKYRSMSGVVLQKEYKVWTQMLRRCYNKDRLRVYENCTVSDSFKNFQFFAEWCNNQIGFSQEGWHLDKDILVKGNKVYSEVTCCFVPPEVNTIIINRKLDRGAMPLGVTKRKELNLYTARCNSEGKCRNLGNYSTIRQAFGAYKFFKQVNIRRVADKWRHLIDRKVYESLVNWEVEIND